MSTPEHELIALEREWMEAIQRKDLARLERILAPEYVYTASGQGRWSRQRWLETVAVYDVHAFTFVDVNVRVYGDVAVVLPHVRQTATVAGATRSGEFLLTDVWVRRDGQWQVVTRSSVLMPEAAQAAPEVTTAATNANKAVVRRFYEEVWNKGNTDELDALAAPHLVLHERSGAAPYLERWKGQIAAIRAGFDDIRVTLEDLIGEGNKVVSRWTFEGTHTGEFQGTAPTGKGTVLTGITVFRIQHGKMTECWNSADSLGWMQQLGAIPYLDRAVGQPPELAREAGAGGPANAGHAVPTEENKAVIRRLFEEVFNAGDVDAVAELVAHDVLGYDATSSEPRRGLESVRQVAVLFRTAFPDLHMGLEHLVAEGDKVVARWTLRGTHRGTFMGIPATGKEAAMAGIVIYRLAGGKIAEYWGSFDALGLMRQLGAIPDRAGGELI